MFTMPSTSYLSLSLPLLSLSSSLPSSSTPFPAPPPPASLLPAAVNSRQASLEVSPRERCPHWIVRVALDLDGASELCNIFSVALVDGTRMISRNEFYVGMSSWDLISPSSFQNSRKFRKPSPCLLLGVNIFSSGTTSSPEQGCSEGMLW